MRGGGSARDGAAVRRIGGLAVHALLVLATALLLQRTWLQRGNTLEDAGTWRSAKVGLDYGILGAVAFLTTRTALAGDRLDLATWHGYQGVHTRRAFAPARLAASLRLEGPGYLVVWWARAPGRMAGVRLSSDPAFPAACLLASDAGAFLAREALAAPLLDGGAWHRLVLDVGPERVDVALDGRALGACPRWLAGPAPVGLRSGAADHAQVDDLVVEEADGGVWREDFANRRRAGLVLAGAVLAVLAVHAAVLAATRRSRRRQGLGAAPYLAATHVVLLVCAALVWGVDRFLLWPRHPDRVDFRGYVTTFESRRQVAERLAREVTVPRPPGTLRLLALGGSQTWGSGARTRADTWFERLEAKLAAAGRPDVEVVSGGVPAYTAPDLLALYEERWLALEPDVLLLNLGHNDRDPAALERALRAFLAHNAERGIGTVLVPEANAVENRGSLGRLAARHAVLERMGREHGVPVLDVHRWLAERRDEGFLWWDRVHLTPFGQELLARRLAAERETLLGAPPPARP